MKSAHDSATLAARPLADDRWEPLEGMTGFVRSGWSRAFVTSQLRTVDDFLAVTGDALSKPGLGGRYRARLRIRMEGESRSVYLKRFLGEKFWSRFKRWCEDGRWLAAGEREMRTAAALAADGLPVASALAWGVQKRDGQSFVVLAEVPGLPAHRWVAELNPGPSAWPMKREFVSLLAKIAADLHRAGWCHRDFYLCHWFVAAKENGLMLSLIDLQRVFRPRWRSTRWKVKDLAQLNYSATPRLFSNTMRLRFAHQYFGTKHLSAAQKQLIKQVLHKTRVIARHDRARTCQH